MGVRSKFRSRGTAATSMSDKDFDHLCRRRRIHINGHSDFGILNYFGACSMFIRLLADTASACIFYYISSGHHSSYVFLVLWFQHRILKMTGVHQRNTVDFPFFSCVLPE